MALCQKHTDRHRQKSRGTQNQPTSMDPASRDNCCMGFQWCSAQSASMPEHTGMPLLLLGRFLSELVDSLGFHVDWTQNGQCCFCSSTPWMSNLSLAKADHQRQGTRRQEWHWRNLMALWYPHIVSLLCQSHLKCEPCHSRWSHNPHLPQRDKCCQPHTIALQPGGCEDCLQQGGSKPPPESSPSMSNFSATVALTSQLRMLYMSRALEPELWKMWSGGQGEHSHNYLGQGNECVLNAYL